MEQYIVSARKYRPDSFGTLVGQDNIARTLKNSILRGQLAHAYLFCGPRGVGKTSTARIFAKTINCQNPGPDMEPCGKCSSCVSFDEGRSFSIHELDAASNNGVEDIKLLMEKVRIPPQTGRYSVFIIDEVHMLSQAAFNAFLKTLEEPPAHAVFILATTEKHKILPTILSRCQTYDFNRISVEDIVRNLKDIAAREGITAQDEALHVIAVKADGAMRDALTLFDQSVAFCGRDIRYEDVIANLNVLDYEYYFRLVDCFRSGDYMQALRIFDEVLAKGFNALHFISGLSSHLRNMMVSGGEGSDALLEMPASLKQRYRQLASQSTPSAIYRALDICVQCESSYRSSVNQRLHIEFALMRLCAPAAFRGELQSVPAGTPEVTSAAAAPKVQAPTQAVPVRDAVSPLRAEPKSVPVKAAPQPGPKPGLSIQDMLGAGEPQGTEAKEQAVQAVQAPARNIVLKEVEAVWGEIADGYSSKPRLHSAISSASLGLEQEQGKDYVVFYVANEAQKEWIESKLRRELEAKLREGLSSSSVYLRIEVEPDTSAKTPRHYMPTEKARYLMENSEQVRQLCSDLDLDVK